MTVVAAEDAQVVPLPLADAGMTTAQCRTSGAVR